MVSYRPHCKNRAECNKMGQTIGRELVDQRSWKTIRPKQFNQDQTELAHNGLMETLKAAGTNYTWLPFNRPTNIATSKGTLKQGLQRWYPPTASRDNCHRKAHKYHRHSNPCKDGYKTISARKLISCYLRDDTRYN